MPNCINGVCHDPWGGGGGGNFTFRGGGIYFPNGGGDSGNPGCKGGQGATNAIPTANEQCSMCSIGGCLGEDEHVTLSDGTYKLAKDVVSGDKILGLNSEGIVQEQTITNVAVYDQPMVTITLSTGIITCSESHPFFLSDGSHHPVTCLDPGDILITQSGEHAEVVKVAPIGFGKAIGWTCIPDANFFHQGVLNHNKSTPYIAKPL